jgi:Tfp pilus assembly protein FimT
MKQNKMERDHHIKAGGTIQMVDLLSFSLILAICSLFAVPNILAIYHNHNEKNFTDGLMTDLSTARTVAIQNNKHVIFKVDPDGKGYTYGIDDLPHNKPPRYDIVHFARRFDTSNFMIQPSQPIVFKPDQIVHKKTKSTTQKLTLIIHKKGQKDKTFRLNLDPLIKPN